MKPKIQLKTKVIVSTLINSFTILTFIFFSPLEVYLGNIGQFTFSINQIWWLLLLVGIIMIGILDLIEIWLPDLLYAILLTIVFVLGVGLYAQILFLNGSMSSLTTNKVEYSSTVIQNNIIIWLGIFWVVIAFATVMIVLNQKKAYLYITSFISGSAVIMQTSVLICLLITSSVGSYDKSTYLTNEGEFELSGTKNTIVFIINGCDDEGITEPTLAKYPGLFNNLKGFTYYPNATGSYSSAFPSIPYLLTKEDYTFEIPDYQYLNQIYQDSDYLKALQATGTDIRVFTGDQYLGKDAKNYLNNVKTSNNMFTHTDIVEAVSKMFKVAAYQDIPYIFKNSFEYRSTEINSGVLNYSDQAIQSDDQLFGRELYTTKLSTNESYTSAYRFYHLEGVSETDQDDQASQLSLVADITIINDYLKQLQDLGIYKDTTIIITSDYASFEVNTTSTQLTKTARPLMLVKPAGKDVGDAFTISQAPVCHNDLFPTILSSLGSEDTSFGTTITEIPQSDRERSYYRAVYPIESTGEVELQEYLITGDAKELKNWNIKEEENNGNTEQISD